MRRDTRRSTLYAALGFCQLPDSRARPEATLPSSRGAQGFGVILPAKVWMTIFPSFTTKVSVPIS